MQLTLARQPTSWTPRSELELLEDQLNGLSAWHDFMRLREDLEQLGRVSRETRLDAQRRLQALRRAHTALLARTDDSDRESGRLRRGAPRAVLVHRQEWLRGRVGAALQERGVEVVAQLADGADGLGVVVAEQPDVALVEDALPSVSGAELIRQARRMAPRTLLAAQVAHSGEAGRMLEVGATAAVARLMPPGDVAEEIHRLLFPGR